MRERTMSAALHNQAGDREGRGVVAPLLVSIEETARILAVGRSTVYALIGSGELETIHIGRCRRVPVDALQVFVERRRAS
jgi:excisionase family DNA binding protein